MELGNWEINVLNLIFCIPETTKLIDHITVRNFRFDLRELGN